MMSFNALAIMNVLSWKSDAITFPIAKINPMNFIALVSTYIDSN